MEAKAKLVFNLSSHRFLPSGIKENSSLISAAAEEFRGSSISELKQGVCVCAGPGVTSVHTDDGGTAQNWSFGSDGSGKLRVRISDVVLRT